MTVNAARLGRLSTEAGDDRGRWAEAVCDAIANRSPELVTRDHLDMRFAGFERKFAEFETPITRRMIFTQVAGFTALAVVLLLR